MQIYEKWGDENKNYAFSGADLFKKESKTKASKNKILLDQLPSIPTYQKHKAAKQPRKYNPYFVRQIRKVIQSDLIFMKNPKGIEKENDGYQYILIVQDVFSRKIWAAPLKDKRADTVLVKLNEIFQILKPFHKNARFVIDRGTEYLNKKVVKMLKDNKIKISHPSTGHAAHVERANLSLQKLLFQHIDFSGHSQRRWIDFLPKAVNIMNSRYHRIIKMSPNKAEVPINFNKVNEAMSIYRAKAQKNKKVQKPKFKINDLVRIQKLKTVFSRGYDQTFTTEIFKIKQVITHLPITMYKLIDLSNEAIDGSFYENELSAVKGDIFKVEKVIRKNKNKVLVKWEGFPEKFNSWIENQYIIEK